MRQRSRSNLQGDAYHYTLQILTLIHISLASAFCQENIHPNRETLQRTSERSILGLSYHDLRMEELLRLGWKIRRTLLIDFLKAL